MRVIAARSNFLQQRQHTIQPGSVLPQLDSYCIVAPGGRMPLFLSSFYGNGGRKFPQRLHRAPQRLPGAKSYATLRDLNKILGILTGKFVLLLGIGCAVMFAFGSNANANRIPVPPSINLKIGDQHELGQVQLATPQG
jgi:hypothetical protein